MVFLRSESSVRAVAVAFTLLAGAGCSKQAPPVSEGVRAVAAASAAVASPPISAMPGSSLADGSPAPDFSAKASDGTELKLEALKGKQVVLYFYPKDETPGCTQEACSFRDSWDTLSNAGVVLIGVSADTDSSHREFAAHHKLPFHLVADPEGVLAAKYGVPAFGRQTFVIGPDGTLKKVFRKVDVRVHAEEIAALVAR